MIGFDNVFILIKDVRNILINLVLIFAYLLYILEEIDILKFSFEWRFICLCIDIFCILEWFYFDLDRGYYFMYI